VELTYVKTTDVDNELKSSFSKGERMGFRVGVQNIAMTSKTATFVVSVFDEIKVAIGAATLADEHVPPGTSEYFVKDVAIPESAFAGQGLAAANAFKNVEGAFVPWCPEVQTDFQIGLARDVAVLDVIPSAREVLSNETVNISVVVKNKGQVAESFNVNIFYESSLVGTTSVNSLAPGAEKTLSMTWSTVGVQTGDYRIKAEAEAVPGETFLSDNVFVDGYVRISTSPTPPAPILDMRSLLAMLFILTVLVAAVLVIAMILLLCCRRRKKEEDEKKDVKTVSEYAAPRSYSAKKCSVCPHCMSFHGKDF
jgi:hypothetical protein